MFNRIAEIFLNSQLPEGITLGEVHNQLRALTEDEVKAAQERARKEGYTDENIAEFQIDVMQAVMQNSFGL